MFLLEADEILVGEIAEVAADDDVLVEIVVAGQECLEFAHLRTSGRVARAALHGDGELGTVGAGRIGTVAVVIWLF